MDSESAFQAIMGALLEFQGAVSNRFDRVDAKLAQHDTSFEVIEGRLCGLEFHFGSLDRRVGHIETRVENLETRFGNLETRFGSMEIRFGEMESTMQHIGADVKQLQRQSPGLN
jgi:predicted nuclease with TOPRIM domain